MTLTNELQPDQMAPFLPQVDPRVSMHAYGVSYDPNNGDGSSVGYNEDTTVGVGETITYYWRAPASEGLYLFRDMGMPAGGEHDGGGSEHGLYGGLAVEPAGAHWFDPTSGAELSSSCRTSSTHRSPARVATSTSSPQSPSPTDGGSASPWRSAKA